MRYEASLDGIRAVAVSGVVAVHVGVPIAGGGTGVEVFFALSGYLITRILVEEETRTGRIDLRRFYYRRALRLLPALAAVLLAVLFWALTFGGRLGEQLFSGAMALFYLMNLNRAFGWGSDLHLGHTWSLSMEEQFYFLWPFVLMALRPRWRLAGTLAMVALVCGWRAVLLGGGLRSTAFTTDSTPIRKSS
ncbi:acyltransferase family protein [uncultured Sphingomonas sp.]|uniref:acyltransferase family protein n=1 Tax=uncultured Sphingomonas sp. TaxID=158754 RepID=UPI0035CB7D31